MKLDPVKTVCISIVALAAIAFAIYSTKRWWDAAGEMVQIPRDLIKAVNTKTIITEFKSTSTTVNRGSKLQVGTVSQLELFRLEETRPWWPDSIVSATVPVEYTYVVDLKGVWDFSIESQIESSSGPKGEPQSAVGPLTVIVPRIEFNTPAPDVSKTEFKVEHGSMLTNETAVIEALRKSITPQLQQRGVENVDLIREAARREVENFIRDFIGRQYGDLKSTRVIVYFSDDELPPASQTAVPLPPKL